MRWWTNPDQKGRRCWITGKNGLSDLGKAALVTGIFVACGYWSAVSANDYAQSSGGPVPTGDIPPIWTFAFQQGGIASVLLVVLWAYRRDYIQLADGLTALNKEVMDLLRANTEAQVKSAEALRENNVIVHMAKNVMREYLPKQDSSITNGGMRNGS